MKCSLTLFLLWITCLPLLQAANVVNPDLEQVRKRTIDLLTLGEGEGPNRMQVIRDNDEWCEAFLSGEQKKLVPGDWDLPQINYKVVQKAENWRRVALAYQTPGSRFYKDDNLLEPLFSGLSNILDYFNPDTPKPENWHPWLIIIPRNLGELGLLMEDVLPPELMVRLQESLADELQEMRLNGANAAWEARNHAYLALLQRDPERLSRAARQVFRPVRYTYGSGVREDFSHLFHGHIPYAGGYGAGFAETVSQFLVLFDKTQWAPRPEKAELIANFLLEHALYYVHEGYLDPHIVGRGYESQRSARQLTEATLFMSQVDTTRREELKDAAIYLIQNGAPVSQYVANFADQLQTDLAPRQFEGFRYWYCSEMGVYNGEGFHIGFRQYSNRVQDYEFLTLKGGEGWNLAYGFTYITRNGKEWYPEGLHPEVDMYYLPGTTTRLGAQPINSTEKLGIGDAGYSLNYGKSAFAGAAGHGDGGAAGFILIPTYGNFIANKSLHFFPEGYWAIGSGIRSTESIGVTGHVVTPVLQWPVDKSMEILLNDIPTAAGSFSRQQVRSASLYIDGIGIFFPEETEIWLEYVDGILRAWIDHGIHPENGKYAYALLPHVEPDTFRAFCEFQPVKPQTSGDTIHVVMDERRGATSAVFFKPGSAGDISVDHPAIVYHELSGSGMACSIQNPLHTRTPIDLTCPSPGTFQFSDEEVRLISKENPIGHYTIDTNIGRIYRFGTGELGQSLQPVPRVDMESMHTFNVAVENSPETSVLHVNIAKEALDEGYELTLSGHKGHLLKVFANSDIVDRNGNVITYLWDRAPADPEVPDIMKQRAGDFRLYLRTEMKSSIDYFTIPAYDAEGNVDPTAELPRDRNKP